ncbi:hypothetical protein [Streptomyces sp. rh34]|uniref:hypothetical protein n=1 Tax=Streptomyces sp. rh34 TaxID=2034272 RepID=UPI000BF0F3B7|nr:hypothetical protein [Streptomyces sp. rh34]
MGLRQIAIHAWSWLNYKPVYSDAMGMPNRRAFPEAQAMWVPAEDERRLAAYKLLSAYDHNQAAEIAEVVDGASARDRREFGDPSMFIDTLVANVLGRDQKIVVPGAEQTAAGEADAASVAMAERVQDLLRDWAKAELLPMRLQQCERKTVALGDGVYRMAWDPAKRRPTLRVTDPGFYFPVIGEDDDGGEYPRRVHFAWELPADPKRGLKARLRRITYELDWIRPLTVAGVDETGTRAVRALPPPPDSVPSDADATEPVGPALTPGDIIEPESGAIARQYAWNDEPSYFTCYLTDATWIIGDIKGPVDVDSLPAAGATYATRSDGEVLDHLDLLIDFIPVVHVPNTVPPAEEHWGQSSLAKALQVFDELAGSDTDSARASATTGLPMLAVSGVSDPRQELAAGPGMVFKLGDNGRLTAVDTSNALAELRNHVADLKDRASTIVRLPAVSLGTLSPSEVPSGFAMQISLGPLDSLIGSMRLAREHKEALVLKFAQRLYIAGQHPDWVGVTPQDAELVRGPYTPTDKAAVLEQVANGVEKGVLSLETGVRMLTDAGFPIDDVEREIEQIQSRQFEQARFLADALGNAEEVADFLGRQAPEQQEAPAPVLPPVGNEGEEDDEDPLTQGQQGSGGNE